MSALASYSHDAERDLGAWSRDMAGVISRKFQNRLLVCQDHPANNPVCNASQSLQVSSPSLPNEYGARDMDRASPRVARKPANDRAEVRTGLHLALTQKIPTYRIPAKEVAGLADTSEGTVRSLRQANIPEAMVTLVMLGRAFPEFRSEVARLMGLERDIDPDFQRQFAALMQRVL